MKKIFYAIAILSGLASISDLEAGQIGKIVNHSNQDVYILIPGTNATFAGKYGAPLTGPISMTSSMVMTRPPAVSKIEEGYVIRAGEESTEPLVFIAKDGERGVIITGQNRREFQIKKLSLLKITQNGQIDI